MEVAQLLSWGKAGAIFVVVLGILVFFHELGHFLIARLSGVTVVTFSLGFGTKLITRKWGETEYCISLIPLGGYVRLLGDDPAEPVAPELEPRAFLTQAIYKKCAIVMAGPFFNFLLALIIFIGIFLTGVPILKPEIGSVQKGAAASRAGMKPGDLIQEIEGHPIHEWEEIRNTLQELGGKPLSVTVQRADRTLTLSVTPTRQFTEDLLGDTQSLWLMGIMPKGTYTVRQYGLWAATGMGFARTWDIAVLNLSSLVKIFTGKIGSENIGGPILIAQMAQQQAAEGIANILLFIAVISVSLGVMNLLPVPVLDGGHLLFFLIEGVLGRPLDLKIKERMQQVGVFLLASLMVFAFYNDIMRIFLPNE